MMALFILNKEVSLSTLFMHCITIYNESILLGIQKNNHNNENEITIKTPVPIFHVTISN